MLHQVLQPVEIHDLGSWDPESSAIIVPVPIAIPAGTGYGCAMYIRRTTIKSRQTGEPYYTYRLVDSIREGKQVRQRTLLNLGRRFEVPREQWPALVQRIEHLVGGQQDLMPADLDAQWDEAAQRYAAQLIRARASVDESGSGAGADYHTVDVDSLQLLRPRSVAIEEVITLYDLTNTYFEGTAQGNANAHLGKSKEKRSDCPLVTLALVLDASGFAKRSEIFSGNISEPKTLSTMIDKLASGHTDNAPTVVLDAGIATEENIAWLVEHGYRYLVVSRKRHREFDPDAAVLIKEDGELRIRAQRVINTETGEVELYCHSSQREKKEHGIAELFAKRFEAALEKLAEGLHKKGAVKRYEKVLERLGRLRQKYSRAAQYYEISVEQDPASGKATAIHWQRTTPIARDPARCLLPAHQPGTVGRGHPVADLHDAHRSGGGLPLPEIRAWAAAHLPSQDRPGQRASVHLGARLPLGAHDPFSTQGRRDPSELGGGTPRARRPGSSHRHAQARRRQDGPHSQGHPC